MKKLIVTLSSLLVLVVILAFSITANADEKIDISDVVLNKTSYTYTGKKIIPEFTVYDQFGNEVEAGVGNYTFYTSNSKNAGTASVRITGRNNYQGVITKEYTISKCKISNAETQAFFVYLDSVPELKLKYNNKTLVNGIDYTYTVDKASKAGEKTIYHVTGIGNFSGTKDIKKTTCPRKVKNFKVKNRSVSGFDLSWNSQSSDGVKNYKIYRCDKDGNNRKLISDTSKNSATVKGCDAGEVVYLVARSYIQVNDSNYYSEFSKVFKTVTKPSKVTNTGAIKSKDKKKLKLEWEKIPCSGYQIQYSTDKNFKKNINKVTVNGSSTIKKTVNIRSNNKLYYTRVRAFKNCKINGKTVPIYGAWSNKISTEYNKVYEFYKTPYPYNPNRTTNLKLACKAINGTILKPGETFSFNAVVGQRTAAKGYKEATIFTGSTGTAQSTGGGICQVASTLFNAALYCNFQIVERHQHSQRVAYCPLGRDAAIFWGSEDLKFKNTSNFPVKIEMRAENGYVYCDIKVNYDVSPAKVKLEVNQSGRNFTLKRYANGKCNYTTKSTY